MKKIIALLTLFFSPLVYADSADFIQNLKTELAAEGVPVDRLEEALVAHEFPYPGLQRKITGQPEFTFSFKNYLNRLVSQHRINKGRKLFTENKAKLIEVEAKYDVPAQVVTALWGIETNYGKLPGKYPIISVLATHVYHNYRADFFKRELKAALQILDEGHVQLDNFEGSWAGAMGQCQFMPTSFTNYSADGDADGKNDIWTNRSDVFASAANYLSRHGWKTEENWNQRVYLSKILPKIQISKRGLGERETVAYWKELGIKPVAGDLPEDTTKARLFLPYGTSGKAYLVYDNFEVIMKWNRSSAFAFSVLTLADKINEVR